MRKNAAVAALVLLAVCIGLGIPLGASAVQDRVILNKSESIPDADATLELNTRGSVSLAQKYWLLSTQRLSVTELSDGRYMTMEQAGEKALEYIGILNKYDVNRVKTMSDGEYYIDYRTPQLMMSETNSRAPSLIAWNVCVSDSEGSVNFLIDDETGALLSLLYIDRGRAAWESGEKTEPDMSKLSDIVGEFAQMYGAEVIGIRENTNDAASNFNEFDIDVMFPGGLDITAFAENPEAEQYETNTLTLRVNSMAYTFNDGGIL